jgi:hypothetical protein
MEWTDKMKILTYLLLFSLGIIVGVSVTHPVPVKNNDQQLVRMTDETVKMEATSHEKIFLSKIGEDLSYGASEFAEKGGLFLKAILPE